MSSPEGPITKENLHRSCDGDPKSPITQLQDSLRTLQPPRLQTQVRNAHDLRSAVESALRYDGLDPCASDPVAPSFLPFSGNFILDASFTLPNDADPLFDKVQRIDQSQKADCAQLAQQLLYLIEEVDGFTYVRKGNGSQLHGLKTVLGWYFHYVCGASREHFPEKNDTGDCRGNVYVSISTERIYIYYTHRDLHDPSTPHNFPKDLGGVLPGLQPPSTPPHSHPNASPTNPTPALISSPIVSPYSSPPSSGRSTPLSPSSNILPKVHPTPVEIDDSVRRNNLKLGALRDLVDTWLPEDNHETNETDETDETRANPFLQMTFRFMVEWFESSMGHPKVQREIYKILDLENATDGEEEGGDVVGYDVDQKPAYEPLWKTSSKRTQTQDTGSPNGKPKLSLEVPKKTRRSVRELLKLGYGTMLSPIVEDPVKRPPGEKRKSSGGSYNAGEKKKNKTGA